MLRCSDWWPALGVALHASTDGGELAQTALVELLGHFMESVVLLPWTAPMAELWPERRTVNNAATGWGRLDYRLDAIIRDQKKLLVDVAGNKEAFLDRYGVGGKPITGPLTNEADLRKLLVDSAHAGQSPGGNTGPWSWLADTMLLGDEWLRPAFVPHHQHDRPPLSGDGLRVARLVLRGAGLVEVRPAPQQLARASSVMVGDRR